VQVRANEYLEQSDIGEAIKSEIKASWVINQTLNSAILTNTSEHAVYVEFGVGIVGESAEHPRANESGYQYNVPSDAKDNTGGWKFPLPEEEFVDLPRDKYTVGGKKEQKWVYTRGSKGCWYAYNALTDLATYPQNLKTIWKEVLVKNLG
jgi:hypothetical protein